MAGLQPTTTYQAVLGNILLHLRQQAGHAQGDIAQAAGVAQGTWSRIERGESHLTVTHLYKVAPLLHRSPASILEHADHAVQRLTTEGVQVLPEAPASPVGAGLVLIGIAAIAVIVSQLLMSDES